VPRRQLDGSKGLKKVEPFEVDAGRGLAEEGSVLIASSAAKRTRTRPKRLRGSFFTHYWNAGLRGCGRSRRRRRR
jgi:hypothetical protein